jgi:hypothetical protein
MMSESELNHRACLSFSAAFAFKPFLLATMAALLAVSMEFAAEHIMQKWCCHVLSLITLGIFLLAFLSSV